MAKVRLYWRGSKAYLDWVELDVNPAASMKAPRGVRSVAVRFYDRARCAGYTEPIQRARHCGCSWLTPACAVARSSAWRRAQWWPAVYWSRATPTRLEQDAQSLGSGERFRLTAMPGGRCAACRIHWWRYTKTMCRTGSRRIPSWQESADTCTGFATPSARTWSWLVFHYGGYSYCWPCRLR